MLLAARSQAASQPTRLAISLRPSPRSRTRSGSAMKPTSVEDVYPLAPLQEGLLFHALYEPDSPAYFDQYWVRFAGRLHEDAFTQAWRLVVERHPALRTSFAWKSGRRPMQAVARTMAVPLERYDWSHDGDG